MPGGAVTRVGLIKTLQTCFLDNEKDSVRTKIVSVVVMSVAILFCSSISVIISLSAVQENPREYCGAAAGGVREAKIPREAPLCTTRGIA